MTRGESPEADARAQALITGRSGSRMAALACLVVLAGLLSCVGQWTGPTPQGRHRTQPIEGAGSEVGAAACRECHDSFEEHVMSSEAHADCESCHGPAQLHAYTARARDIRFPSSEDCASCHEVGRSTLMGWSRSPHHRADVLCSDCHDTHDREPWNLRRSGPLQAAAMPRASDTTRLCASCHPEIAARFDLPSHHPLGEGMLGCSDCHGAHESDRDALGDPTRRCVSCHQEVAGPWIYEHPPATEDCGHCHVPHGATSDFLMRASEPSACISCHTIPIAGAAHQPFGLTTACSDCHNAVHGSYADPHLRK